MNNDIKKNISVYITYFHKQIQSITDLCQNANDGELYSRILYIALLDAITSSVTSNKLKSKKDFIFFVTKFCDWPECNRVSLPHLSRLLYGKTDPKLIPLVNYVANKQNVWLKGDQIFLSRDPEISEVADLWLQKNKKLIRIDDVSLHELQHSHLLYTYRNHLVHEFRIPGRHVKIWDIEEPYYGSLAEYKDVSSWNLMHSWELQYPAKFFRRLCNSGLSNLEKYLIAHMIDPLESIDSGNFWLKQLNKNN